MTGYSFGFILLLAAVLFWGLVAGDVVRLLVAFIRWGGGILALVVLDVLGLVVVPVALLFTTDTDRQLPWWAWAWSNAQDGINGDSGWQRRWGGVKAVQRFWPRFVWLALRNRSHNARRFWFGISPAQPVWRRAWTVDAGYSTGPRTMANAPSDTDGVTGIEWIRTPWAFQLYIVVRWPCAKHRCVRVLLGWKLWHVVRAERAGIAFMVHPWFKYGYVKGAGV